MQRLFEQPLEFIYSEGCRVWYFKSDGIRKIALADNNATYCIYPDSGCINFFGKVIQCNVDSLYLSKIFGIFAPRIRAALEKIPCPEPNEGPMELDFGKITVNYF